MINHALCTTIPEDEPENEVRGLQNLSAPSAGYFAASASRRHQHDVMSRTTQIHGLARLLSRAMPLALLSCIWGSWFLVIPSVYFSSWKPSFSVSYLKEDGTLRKQLRTLFPLQTLIFNRTQFLNNRNNCTVTPAMTKAKVLAIGGHVRPLGSILYLSTL